MKYLLEQDDYNSLNDAISCFYGIKLTNEQWDAFFERNGCELAAYGAYGADTCVRESIGQRLCQELCGMKWPTFGECREDPTLHDKVNKAFDEGVAKSGYKRV